MAVFTAIVFLVSVCNYQAPLSMANVQSIYVNQLQSTLATCTKNRYVMDVFTNHRFVQLTIPCAFPAAYDNNRIININDYNASTSIGYAYEMMLYAVSKYDTSKYGYQMMILPQMPIMGFIGLGTLSHTFSWYIGAHGFSERIFAHEFGHNLGFGHAAQGGQEYGDASSVMGSGQWSTCYTAPHRHIGGFDRAQKVFAEMPNGDVVIDKRQYIVIRETLFFEAKDAAVYTYFLTEGNRTCSICTLFEEGQSCVFKVMNTYITLVSDNEYKVTLQFVPFKNMNSTEQGPIDLCQSTEVRMPQPPPAPMSMPPNQPPNTWMRPPKPITNNASQATLIVSYLMLLVIVASGSLM